MELKRLQDIVCDEGTPVSTCSCGRTHFGDGDCMEEGEHEGLLAKARERPEKYISHPDAQSMSIGEFAGMHIVWDCQCDALARYERFIWENRSKIIEYIKARAEYEKSVATQTLSDLMR